MKLQRSQGDFCRRIFLWFWRWKNKEQGANSRLRIHLKTTARKFKLSIWKFRTIQKTWAGCGCPKFVAGRVFRQSSTLLEDSSPIFRQHKVAVSAKVWRLSGKETAAGKSAPPSGTLLHFSSKDCHSLFPWPLSESLWMVVSSWSFEF